MPSSRVLVLFLVVSVSWCRVSHRPHVICSSLLGVVGMMFVSVSWLAEPVQLVCRCHAYGVAWCYSLSSAANYDRCVGFVFGFVPSRVLLEMPRHLRRVGRVRRPTHRRRLLPTCQAATCYSGCPAARVKHSGWRVFGCPKSTYDLVAKVEDDIRELEAN